MAVTGGSPATIVADAELSFSGARGATWGDDGTIVYAGQRGLYQVAAGGGEAELIAEPADTGQLAQPYLLPGSQALLFHQVAASQDPERAEIFALSLATGERSSLLGNAINARYGAEARRLFFIRQGTMLAVAFDPERLEILGQPVIAVENVMQALGMPNGSHETGAAQLAVSSSGHLAYASGGAYADRPRLISRVTIDGGIETLVADPFAYNSMRVSPDGERLAFFITRGRGSSVHIRDLARGVTRRLNTGGFVNANPNWSPDGTAIAFSSDSEDGDYNVYRIAADGSGEPERLAPSRNLQFMSSWSADGAIAWVEGADRPDIWVLPPNGEAAPFLDSDVSETYPSFSPDGRWLVYVSNESGQDEVYVRPYPGSGPATLISGNGGRSPAWSSDGAQIYFLERDVDLRQARMMVADVTPGNPFRAGRPRVLLDPWPATDFTLVRGYDVLGDGGFVLSTLVDGADTNYRTRFAVDEFQVVLNFLEEFGRRVGE